MGRGRRRTRTVVSQVRRSSSEAILALRRKGAAELREIGLRSGGIARERYRLRTLDLYRHAPAEDDAPSSRQHAARDDLTRRLPFSRRRVHLPLARNDEVAAGELLVEADEVEHGRSARDEKISLFSGLDDRELESLADEFKERRFSAGDRIALEGEGGMMFFVVERARLRSRCKGKTSGGWGRATRSARSR